MTVEVHQATQGRLLDYNLHGIIGVRLIDPLPSDVWAVRMQLGPLEAPWPYEPDIVVRFVDSLPTWGLRYVGIESGFTDSEFFIRGRDGKKSKVRIALDPEDGQRWEIICESGMRSVPLLPEIVNLAVLRKDFVALHGSAFVYQGTGIIATGWTKGGKTEALLAFASQGAEYVGDECILLSGDGQRMYGIPRRVLLWNWQLNQLPRIRSKVPYSERLLFGTINALDRIQNVIPDGKLSETLPIRLWRQAMPVLRHRCFIRVTPQELFGAGDKWLGTKVDKVFLMMGHEDSAITVEPITPREIVRRMVWSNREERADFMGYYCAFRFAFAEESDGFAERTMRLEAKTLERALLGKPAFLVRHPYPCSLSELYEAMKPFAEGSTNRVLSGLGEVGDLLAA